MWKEFLVVSKCTGVYRNSHDKWKTILISHKIYSNYNFFYSNQQNKFLFFLLQIYVKVSNYIAPLQHLFVLFFWFIDCFINFRWNIFIFYPIDYRQCNIENSNDFLSLDFKKPAKQRLHYRKFYSDGSYGHKCW